jgi:ribosomal protein S27AE
MYSRILIKRIWLAGRKGGRIGGRGTIEHHGKEYIEGRVLEVALTAYVDPRNTSKECPRCGLKMNRHKAASINIRRRYLEGKRRARMRDSPQQ